MGTGIIDRTQEIQRIRVQYGRDRHTSKEVLQSLKALWDVECNDHGVIQNARTEILADIGSCRAIVHLAETRQGHWLVGLNAQSSYSGSGYAPSVWDTVAFTSQWYARKFAASELIGFFNGVARSQDICNSEKNRRDAQKVVGALKNGQAPQMSLF